LAASAVCRKVAGNGPTALGAVTGDPDIMPDGTRVWQRDPLGRSFEFCDSIITKSPGA
jgi:hypothetical protein